MLPAQYSLQMFTSPVLAVWALDHWLVPRRRACTVCATDPFKQPGSLTGVKSCVLRPVLPCRWLDVCVNWFFHGQASPTLTLLSAAAGPRLLDVCARLRLQDCCETGRLVSLPQTELCCRSQSSCHASRCPSRLRRSIYHSEVM